MSADVIAEAALGVAITALLVALSVWGSMLFLIGDIEKLRRRLPMLTLALTLLLATAAGAQTSRKPDGQWHGDNYYGDGHDGMRPRQPGLWVGGPTNGEIDAPSHADPPDHFCIVELGPHVFAATPEGFCALEWRRDGGPHGSIVAHVPMRTEVK